MTPAKPTLAIVGVGMIGASIARALRPHYTTIAAVDADPAHLAYARERGIVDTVLEDLAQVFAFDHVVVAAPVDASLRIVATLARAASAASAMPELLLDVASLQAPFAAFGAALPTFVTTHPIAGSERAGPEGADAAVFADRTWVYEAPSDPALAERVEAFILRCGAEPYAMDAALHDRLIAVLSHLPQAASVALGAVASGAIGAASDADARALAGPGLASMIRLAGSPASVWDPIFSANANNVAGALRELARRLDRAADGLDAGNTAPLTSYFAESQPAVRAAKRFAPPVR